VQNYYCELNISNMFKCNNCEREFENEIKLRGHSKVHSKKYIDKLEFNN